MANVQEHLIAAIRKAAVYNPDIQAAPVCILWPDKERQWESVISVLQNELPELFVLGDYAPDEPPRSRAPRSLKRCLIRNGGSFERKFIIPSGLIPNFCKRGVIRAGAELRGIKPDSRIKEPAPQFGSVVLLRVKSTMY
jgi:hypothetical protein